MFSLNYDNEPLESSNLKEVKENSGETHKVCEALGRKCCLYAKFDRQYNLRTWVTSKNIEEKEKWRGISLN